MMPRILETEENSAVCAALTKDCFIRYESVGPKHAATHAVELFGFPCEFMAMYEPCEEIQQQFNIDIFLEMQMVGEIENVQDLLEKSFNPETSPGKPSFLFVIFDE